MKVQTKQEEKFNPRPYMELAIEEMNKSLNEPRPDGKGIKHLEKNHVKIIMFDRDLQKIIEDENTEFIKQAKKRKKKKEEFDLLTAIEKPIEHAELSEFSDEALSKFILEAKLNFRTSDASFHDYLADVGIGQFNDKDNVYRPTGFWHSAFR